LGAGGVGGGGLREGLRVWLGGVELQHTCVIHVSGADTCVHMCIH